MVVVVEAEVVVEEEEHVEVDLEDLVSFRIFIYFLFQ
jgi:hypothetical protein